MIIFTQLQCMIKLKRKGKGSIVHHPKINESDRNKICSSLYLNLNAPSGLFSKIQFDIYRNVSLS